MTLADFKRKLLVAEAARWSKLFEIGGNRDKGLNRLFAKSVEDKTIWPLSVTFIKTCVNGVDSFVKDMVGLDELPAEMAFRQNPAAVWDDSSILLKTRFPKSGDIVVWGYFSQGKKINGGHLGIVKETLPNGQVVCIEGFSPAGQDPVIKPEEGIYTIKRDQIGYTNMKIMGYISPWKFN